MMHEIENLIWQKMGAIFGGEEGKGDHFSLNREKEMPPRAEIWAGKYKVEDEAGCG